MACQHTSCACVETPVRRAGGSYCSETCAAKAEAAKPVAEPPGASSVHGHGTDGCRCGHPACATQRRGRGAKTRAEAR